MKIEIERENIDRLFALANQCINDGNRPMPALLVKGKDIKFESCDMVFESLDPTMHGEIAVIRQACTTLNSLSLKGYGLICFAEPCLMCCGAIHWSRIESVAYCLSQKRLKTISMGLQKPGIKDYLPLGNNCLEVIGPIYEDEAYKIASRYDWVGKAV